MPPVWETLCHHLMTPKRLHHVCIWTMLCLTCFLGEVVSNCPTKYTNLPNNPTVVWFSAHLWGPFGGPARIPKNKLSTVYYDKASCSEIGTSQIIRCSCEPHSGISGADKSSPFCEKLWHLSSAPRSYTPPHNWVVALNISDKSPLPDPVQTAEAIYSAEGICIHIFS